VKEARAGRAGGRGESATVAVKVLPRASKEEVAGLSEDAVRIRLTAPALENRANEALVRFLAAALGVPRARVGIVAGGRGRRKLVRVEGLSREELYRRLGLER
jgi:uncharacterized protein